MKLSKNLNKIKKVTATVLGTTMVFSFAVSAFANQRFVDIPTTHWAHEYVISVSDQGFMVGNAANEFRPNAPLDKFETARILASIAGFRIVGATEEQQAIQDQAYENNADILLHMEEVFERWSTTSNREIALLLELGIFTQADLYNFIVVADGEQLRALSRQEAAVFLTRVFGFADHAAAGVHTQLFADDGQITATSRHYVYFLRSHNVIGGDGTGYFFPNEFVTRAALSIMIYRTQNLEIDEPVAPQQPVVLPGLTNIPAPVQAVPIPEPVTAPIPSPTGNIPAASTMYTVPPRRYVVAPPSPVTLHGTISQIDQNYVMLVLRHLTTSDLVVTDVLTLPMAINATFSINGRHVEPDQFITGDIVTVEVSTGTAFSVDAIERSRSFSGVVSGRVETSVPGQAQATQTVFTIRDEQGVYHNLVATNTTVLERAGLGHVQGNQIRIGDTVEIEAEGQNLVSMFAFGQNATVDGYVHSMIIRSDLSEILVRVENIYVTYFITGQLEGIASLNVGDRVRLRVDSLEIEGFTILD